MAAERRLGNKTAKSRALLLQAAETLFCTEGYASVTARRVAQQAGLKVQLVYYYFQTMDDLIIEMIRQHNERRMKDFVRALASKEPLRALWELNRHKSSAIFTTETLALANHKDNIRTEIAAIGAEFRSLQSEAVGQLLAERGVDLQVCPASAIVATISALCRAMAQDCALGVSEGYEEAVQVIEQMLDRLNQPQNTAARSAAEE